jgi:hypothetical protein
MRTVAKAILALCILGAMLPVPSALAQYYPYPPPPPPPDYGGYYGRPAPYGYPPPTWNGCPPGYTIQGGVCQPYRGPVGGGYRTWNGCPRGFTVQDGVCKPYRGY